MQKLSLYREDVLEKKQAEVRVRMIFEEYEERERQLNSYFDTVSKQYDRAVQFYKEVDKFEEWYPEIEEKLLDEEELDSNPDNLKRLLAHFEVFHFLIFLFDFRYLFRYLFRCTFLYTKKVAILQIQLCHIGSTKVHKLSPKSVVLTSAGREGGPGDWASWVLHTNALACSLARALACALERSPQCRTPRQHKVITLATDNRDLSRSTEPELERAWVLYRFPIDS